MELCSDLILRLFSLLPLKALVRFKLVCKQWQKTLEDNPQFFSRIYSENTPYTISLFSDSRWEDQMELYLVEVSNTSQDCIVTTFKPRFPMSGSWWLRGSCNGLLCLSSNDKEVVSIWNPMINGSDSVITLPRSTIKRKENDIYRCCDMVYVFGYSSAFNKFKVLKILIYWDRRSRISSLAYVDIFTIGVDDEWRCLPDPIEFKYSPLDIYDGVVVNGVFYWIQGRSEEDEGISTIDLGEEKRGLMPWPCRRFMGHQSICFERLNVLNNQLAVIQYFRDSSMLSIWTMKEYGAAESWTRIDILQSGILLPLTYLAPCLLLQNGIVLFLCERKFFFYDPTRKELNKVEDQKVEGLDKIGNTGKPMISYAPCFVPLAEVINAHDNGE